MNTSLLLREFFEEILLQLIHKPHTCACSRCVAEVIVQELVNHDKLKVLMHIIMKEYNYSQEDK